MTSVKKNNVLGSYISKYKHEYRHKKAGSRNSADILEVINRLERHNNYLKQIRKEKRMRAEKFGRKTFKKLKRLDYQKAFHPKPVINPYVEMILKQRREGKVMTGIDRYLLDKYKSINIYTLFEFRHIPLPRANYEIRAGQAWHALIDSWKGYKISKAQGNDLLMEDYAHSTQNWAHMLELPMIPDFSDIGVSLEGFLEGKKLKVLDLDL